MKIREITQKKMPLSFIMPIILVLCFIFNVNSVYSQNLPTSADNTVTGFEDNIYVFSETDFPYNDADGDPFTQVRIYNSSSLNMFYDADNDNILDEGEGITNMEILTENIPLLKYLPPQDLYGNYYGAICSFRVHDGNDGYQNGSQNMFIDIIPINDEPLFTLGANQFITENAGAQTVPAWATHINQGGSFYEDGQTLTFHLSNDNNSFFAEQPAVDVTSGNLTYATASDAYGTVYVEIYLTDDGGTTNGGDDTSPTYTFTVTVIGSSLWSRQDENTVLLNLSDNVGIGTNNPKKSLHIYTYIDDIGPIKKSTLRLQNYYEVSGSGEGTTPPIPVAKNNSVWDIENNKNYLNFKYGKGSVEHPVVTKISFDKTGRIGIGTSEPQTQLHIKNDDASIIRLETIYDNGTTPGNGNGNGNSNKSIVPASCDLRMEETTLHFDFTRNSSYLPSKFKFLSNGTLTATKFVGDGSGLTNVAGAWDTNGDNIYYDAGNVGIKTPNPEGQLQINSIRPVIIKNNGGSGIYGSEIGFNAVLNTHVSPNKFKKLGGTIQKGGAVIVTDQYGSMYFQTYNAGTENESVINYAPQVTFKNNGNVGIGTTSPGSKLHIDYNSNRDISKKALYSILSTQTTANVTSYDKAVFARLTSYSIPSGITDSGYKIALDASSYSTETNFAGTLNSSYGVWARAGIYNASSGAKINNAIAVNAQVLDNVSGTTIENAYGVYINTGGYGLTTVNNRYDLYAGTSSAKNYFAGNVGIGTSNPDEKLTVNGNVTINNDLWVKQDIWVQTTSPWGDYVFDKDYKLMPLYKLEKFIKNYKHLPGIPSAKDIKEKGLNLADTDAAQMVKIEELTLYIIEQNKRIEKLEKQIKELQIQ
ncbi:MAG: hypothetical protein K8R54_09945 [Bacteroidales bacterium]|nr:hypothetical protein [Bacteroidales bacterium]